MNFDTSLEVTSSNEFCISCHEMSEFPLAEMQDSIHSSNRTGLKVTCADCHVPLDTVGKVARKSLLKDFQSSSSRKTLCLSGTLKLRKKVEFNTSDCSAQVMGRVS